MGVLDIKRDGPVSLKQLDDILAKMHAEIEEAFTKMGDAVGQRLHEHDAEIKKLRAELETERRLRLGSKR